MRQTLLDLFVTTAMIALVSAFGVVPAHADDEAPRPWLGVRLGGASTQDAGPNVGGDGPKGVRITGVYENSPAARTGLRAQDRILSVEGGEVRSNTELIQRVLESDGGTWVTLNVRRDDDDLEFRVRLAERPDGAPRLRKGWIGASVVNLTPQLQEHFGAPEKSGVMLGVIREGSPAFDAGFELGDVVYEIEGNSIRSEKDFMRRVVEAGVGNRVEFKAMRDGVEVIIETVVEAQPRRRGDR